MNANLLIMEKKNTYSSSFEALPFLKWAGGKTQLIPFLERYIPQNYSRYIEPFLGGGALFFNLLPKNSILSDSNWELINAYIAVRDNLDLLLKELLKFENTEEKYYQVREKNPLEMNEVEAAARMIYLNKTCFNGLYRVNKQGRFNVPYGKRENTKFIDIETLTKASKALQGTLILQGDYLEILSMYAQKNDFIFLDPPYYPAGGFSDFKRYTKEFFYENDHIELRNKVLELVDRGCYVVLTNSNTEFVRDLYKGLSFEIVETRRNISCDPKTRMGQDIIIYSIEEKRKRVVRNSKNENALIKNFPGTRYMGSKYAILPSIHEVLKDLEYHTVLDAFAGSTCVSYYLKQQGKSVISNDFMYLSYFFAKAIIENSSTKLTTDDFNTILKESNESNRFITNTFKGLYFSDEDNIFLDNTRYNINCLSNDYKKALALSALARACMKKQPRGIFTFTGNRYDDGRRDIHTSLRRHFIENMYSYNKAVFDNGKLNKAFCMDIFDIDVKADLIYLDPPYLTPNSDNDYSRRYHFVEGLVKNWEGLEIQESTKTKKFKKYETPFSSSKTIIQTFDNLFYKFRNSILLVSYSSNSVPDKETMLSLLGKYKKSVRVFEIPHTYSFGNQGNKVGNNANRALEYLFLAE